MPLTPPPDSPAETSPVWPFPPVTEPKQRLTAVILGYGYMGSIRRQVLEQDGGYDITGIVDPVRGEHPYPRPAGIAQALALKPDAVFCCLPNHLNSHAIIAALDAGCHVFAEMPPARTMAEMQRILLAEGRSDQRKVQFGFNHRQHQSVQHAKQIITTEQLGRVRSIHGVYGQAPAPSTKDWRGQLRTGGGVLLDHGIHLLDLALYLAPGLRVVTSRTDATQARPLETEAWIGLADERGVCAEVRSSAHLRHPTFSLSLEMERGALTLRGLNTRSGAYGKETLIIDDGRATRAIEFEGNPSWAREVTAFRESVTQNNPVTMGTTGDAAGILREIQTVYAHNRQYALGLVVELDFADTARQFLPPRELAGVGSDLSP